MSIFIPVVVVLSRSGDVAGVASGTKEAVDDAVDPNDLHRSPGASMLGRVQLPEDVRDSTALAM